MMMKMYQHGGSSMDELWLIAIAINFINIIRMWLIFIILSFIL